LSRYLRKISIKRGGGGGGMVPLVQLSIDWLFVQRKIFYGQL
jgi:hypothetical protein